MKNMTQASENQQAPAPGWRLSRITSAQASSSKKSGASMLVLDVSIAEGGPFDGQESNDYIITDGSAKGAGMGKKKLRGLATPLVLRAIDTDEDIPDAAIAQELVGLQLFVLFGNEQRMGKADPNDPNSAYDRPMTTIDEKTGKEVPLNKLTVQAYSRSAPPGVNVGGPITQVVPQQPPAQFVPQQGFAPQQVQGFQPQQAQQFAPQQAQGFAPQQQGFAAPGFGGQPGFPGQQAYPQQGGMNPAFPQNVAQPVWNGGQQVAQPEPTGKKGKKGAASEA